MRYYHASGTNCLQCCIASILDLPLEKVVDVSKVDGYWVDTLKGWGKKEGYRIRFTYCIPHVTTEEFNFLVPFVYIAIVDWEISGCHAVVCCYEDMIHNPNPTHTEPYTGSLYNILITKGNEHDTIFQSNGRHIIPFMDSNNIPKEG